MTSLFKRSADSAVARRAGVSFLSVRPELVEGPVRMEVLLFLATLRRDMRPTAHSLSFASPKESKQRKGDPGSEAPCGGCLALLAEGGKRRTRPSGSDICASFSASRCAAQLVSGGPKSEYTTARCASQWLKGDGSPRGLAQPNEPSAGVGSWGPRGRRRAAQGKTEKEVQMFEPAGRVSELPVLHEQRRAVPVLRDRRIRGRLSFGDFSLAKQRKVTALSGAYPDAVQRKERLHKNAHKTQPANKGVAP
ncbi:MAG: hypothetical protein RIS44_3305 [Pseudomonadota bacterium]|jgi:hypothetical protein